MPLLHKVFFFPVTPSPAPPSGNVWFPYPLDGWSLEIGHWRGLGSLKSQLFTGISRGVGWGSNQKTIFGGGYGYFLEQHNSSVASHFCLKILTFENSPPSPPRISDTLTWGWKVIFQNCTINYTTCTCIVKPVKTVGLIFKVA